MNSPQPNQPKPSRFGVLRHRDFALYWGGQGISLTGMWMQVLANNWVILGFTSSAFVLGLLNFTSALPMLMLTLIGGVAADRFDKRRILIVTQFVLMILAFVMAGLMATHVLKLWHIFAVAVVSGIASAYDMPANQAFTPELVEPHEIPQAIALNQSIFHGSRVVGPALAGVMIAALGLVSAYIANGLSFLPVIASLLLIRSRPRHAHASSGSALHSMREGFAYVRERPRLMVLMGFTVLTAFLVFPNLAILLPLYAKAVLHVGEKELGMLMGSSGTGALIGSLLLIRIQKEKRLQRMGLGLCGITLALTLLSQSHNFYLSCFAIFINALGLSSTMGLAATITQEVVPNHLRGRVMSLNSLMFVGVMPFTALIMSGVADLLGLRTELLMCGILYGLGGFFLFRKYKTSPEITDFVHAEPAKTPAYEPVPGEAVEA
jgi:MFS family permease